MVTNLVSKHRTGEASNPVGNTHLTKLDSEIHQVVVGTVIVYLVVGRQRCGLEKLLILNLGGLFGIAVIFKLHVMVAVGSSGGFLKEVLQTSHTIFESGKSLLGSRIEGWGQIETITIEPSAIRACLLLVAL